MPPQTSTSKATIQIQDVDGGCRTAALRCSGVLPGLKPGGSGGSAYDPRHDSLWIADSLAIEEWALAPACRKICTTKTVLMNPKASLRGLAIADRRGLLYVLESAPGYVGIRPWFLRSCPPVPTRGGCSLTLRDSRALAGGLAYDEFRDLLYFTVSRPAFVGWVTDLYVAPASNPCKAVKSALGTCQTGANPWGPVTGLAYEACSKRLYATDGSDTLLVLLLDPLKLVWKSLGCCRKGSAGTWTGLAVLPGWKRRDTGSGCSGKGCPFCGRIRQTLVGGIPSLGNPAFGLQVENGPIPGFGILLLGVGPCGKGLRLPFLCAPFFPSLAPPPLAILSGALSGKGQCLGSVRQPLPLPADPRACGLTLCAQWLVLCGAGSGLALSQAIEFTLAGT